MMDNMVLIAVALCAAVVNGAIGYGFSTLIVPIALLTYPNKVLSPGLVLAEVGLNLLALYFNRGGLRPVWRRVLPLMAASLPGIALGAVLLKHANADLLRLATFVVLLPLVLLQAAGVRRPVRAESLLGLPAGLGIGALYAMTTISGPPLGLLFNNQGLAKDEFRAALSLFRITESAATGLMYFYLSVYTPASVHLSASILPCIVLGIPLGRLLLRAVDPETFRRICMTFDAWLISFGLSRLLVARGTLSGHLSYLPMGAVLVLDVVILYLYLVKKRQAARSLGRDTVLQISPSR